METKVNGDGGLERFRPRQRHAHVDASDVVRSPAVGANKIGGLPCCASSLICFVPTLAFKLLVFPESWIVGGPLTKWRRY